MVETNEITRDRFGEMNQEALTGYYSGLLCSPTTDAQAHRLDRVRWLKELHKKHSDIRFILDIGCHDGMITRWMLNHPCNVIGFDPCEDAIKNAWYMAESVWGHKIDSGFSSCSYFSVGYEGIKSTLARSGIRNDACFDLIVCSELIEHLPQDSVLDLITLAVSLLSPGGHLFFTTPDKHGQWGDCNPDPHHINIIDEAQMKALFGGRGLDLNVSIDSQGLIYAHGVKK